ncbi:MAG: hypothetical protein ACK4RK_09420 [Gemmataceae bacterium]
MKNLVELQAECAALGIQVETKGRASKEPYVAALRDFHWRKDHPDESLPAQIMPMLLGSWEDLDDDQAEAIEHDHHAWIVQPKMDGVRALLHIEDGRVRITSRTVSEVTYRLSELQVNLPHLAEDISTLNGSILDGELVCPVSALDTGSTITGNSLQATMAVLAAAPNKARQFQEGQHAHVHFHVFDILRSGGQDVTPLPLMDRQDILASAFRKLNNDFIESVPSYVVNKPDIHRRLIDAGGEGTVWKKADSPYEPGRRVSHWIKRKRGIEVEAFVTGFKPGTNGHAAMVGAIEFAVRDAEGSPVPIAWVNNWKEQERRVMTHFDSTGEIVLNPSYVGRRAFIEGQDHATKSRRIRHARMVRWLD